VDAAAFVGAGATVVMWAHRGAQFRTANRYRLDQLIFVENGL
jgi:hypothetical protein